MEEVHLWRGSPDQRALRRVSRKRGLFGYFDRQLDHPDWGGKTVLDFGGNTGDILKEPGCTILPVRYYCLDVIKDALDEGRARFPTAHWVHYDRYNFSFNPGGVVGLPIPDLPVRFDIILAYSVFTHTGPDEMSDMVRQLRARLAERGILAFTFIDPHHRSWPETYAGNNLQWRLEKCRLSDPSLEVGNLLERSRDASWCALVDGRELYVDADVDRPADPAACETYHVYYGVDFLRREFPDATIRPPVHGEMQHCCLLGRPACPPRPDVPPSSASPGLPDPTI
jgi:SAM-dependent methyltransferase